MNPYESKDLRKMEGCTAMIGRGAPGSSTQRYQARFERLNGMEYTAADRVFVSVNGDRKGRVPFEGHAQVKAALEAGAVIVADGKHDRERSFNTGERELFVFLVKSGAREVADGVWKLK